MQTPSPMNSTFFSPTNDPSIDTFRVEYLVAPALILGLIFNYKFTFIEIMWSFSIFLEAVAILPQLFMLQRTGEAETITTHYLAALGAYRALYIPNWIYRCVPFKNDMFYLIYILMCDLCMRFCSYFAEGHIDAIAIVAGIVQTALYFYFFYNIVIVI